MVGGGDVETQCLDRALNHTAVFTHVDNYHTFGYLSILQIPASQLDVSVSLASNIC